MLCIVIFKYNKCTNKSTITNRSRSKCTHTITNCTKKRRNTKPIRNCDTKTQSSSGSGGEEGEGEGGGGEEGEGGGGCSECSECSEGGCREGEAGEE